MRTLLVSVSLLAAANFLAACTPKDDADSIATPTPPEDPPVRHCQIVWLQNGTAGLVDVFVLDGPEESWSIAGEGEFDEFTGWYQPDVEFDPEATVYTATLGTNAAMVSSSDSFAFTVGLNTTDVAAPVSVDDPDANRLYTIDDEGAPTTAVFGTGIVMTFDGEWTDPEEESLTPGTGEVTVLVAVGATNSAMVTVGDFGSYGICYEVAAE